MTDREIWLKEYGEVNSNFRMLTDIRFKLLALTPVTTIIAAVAAGSKYEVLSTPFAAMIAAFGLLSLLAVAAYNSRNDQLYNELVGRAAELERRLGVPDGAFACRPKAWLTLSFLGLRLKIEHGGSVKLIYASAAAIWLTGLLYPTLMCLQPWLPVDLTHLDSTNVLGAALGLAVLSTAVITRLCGIQRDDETKRLRESARAAMTIALQKKVASERTAVLDKDFINACIAIDAVVDKSKSQRADEPEPVRARAEFCAKMSTRHYVGPGAAEWRCAQVIALLTDHPPGWIHDCHTRRRRAD